MNRLGVLASVLVIAAVAAHTASAASGVAGAFFDCNSLFTNGATYTGGPSLVAPVLQSGTLLGSSSFTGMLIIGMLLTLIAMGMMGIAYALGRAFGIEKLVSFVKRESVETFMNMVVIVAVLFGGFAIFNNLSIFFSNVAAGGIGSAPPQLLPLVSIAGTGATAQMFIATCNNYENVIINDNLVNYINVVILLFFVHTEVYFQANIAPNDFGVTLAPLTGVQTLQTTVWSEEAISFGIISMGALIIMLLFVIYFLFPFFFYAGLVFRCLPWTRAAGGAMLSLFIAFYIVFPALLYSFSAFNTSTTFCTSSTTGDQTLCNPSSSVSRVFSGAGVNVEVIFQSLFSVIGATQFGNAMYDNVTDFASSVAYSVLQMIGVIVAFIISYDMLEFLGDILGAPSLQSNRILSKVI